MVIELENLVKRFRTTTAVDDFSMKVPEGCLFGFIGPNGSGKTTTLRMILRIIEPDSGGIRVFGGESHHSANDLIAYLPEERGLYRKMTVSKQLQYFGQLKGMSRRQALDSAHEWLDRLGLSEWADKKLEALSKGMSQKIQFISTVMSKPKLLVLDEPFSGLDPVNLESLRSVLLDLKKEGVTIIFSTHDMGTAEEMCDHICMIYKGKKVLDGSLTEIQRSYGEDTIRLKLGKDNAFDPSSISGVDHARFYGRYWDIRYSGEPQELLHSALAEGAIDHFEIIHPTLHDIFVRIANPTETTDTANTTDIEEQR